MKNTVCTLESHINTDIKKGDIVKIVDGSGLNLLDYNHEYREERIYIINSYPDLTKSTKLLKDLEYEVIETNITDKVYKIGSLDIVNLLDCIIDFNGLKFRTMSKCLKKIK